MLTPWKKTYDKPRWHINHRWHHSADKGPYGFSSSHVRIWELDHREGWMPRNWCFQTMVLEKPLESPLDSKEIKPVNPKGNQPWIFIGRTDAEAETEAPIFWPPDVKSQLTGKDPDSGKDWRQEEKRMIEDEMVGFADSMDVSLSKVREMVKDRETWYAAVCGVAKSWTRLTNWAPPPLLATRSKDSSAVFVDGSHRFCLVY